LLCSLNYTHAQEEWEEWENEEDTLPRFFVGANINAYFPNHETAILYTGRPKVTPYGIEFILAQPQYQQEFNDYFQHSFEPAEYPFNPQYRTSMELGVHAAYHLFRQVVVYGEFNVTQLDYEQFFTVAIDDPNNGIPGPTYARFPIFGEENRFILNLGTQIGIFQGETSSAYLAAFAQANDTELRRNYIVINEREYPIFHLNLDNPDLRPGGIGYGGGGGAGFKFELSHHIWVDIHYHFAYVQINLTESLQPRNLQHTTGIRLLWGK
jgi:hypothetical protein